MARNTPTPRPHSSSDRPTVTKVGALPSSAYLHTPRTPFQEILYQLYRAPGEWFRLNRTYTSHHSPIQTLRKTADEFMPGELSERLEFASEPAEQEGRVTVYVRLRPSAAEPQPDLSGRFDEPDSIFDELETVAEAPQ